MHISEGVLSAPVLLSGAVIAIAGTSLGLKNLDYENIARAGILSSAFFVASLIHVPIGFASIHLILNGIVGLLLGWGAFPVIVTALFLQFIFFQFGGITVLGVNVVIMAAPAVICYYLFSKAVRSNSRFSLPAAFLSGFLSVLIGTIIAAGTLVFTEEKFLEVAALLLASHIPVMIIEGLITMFCIGFIKKVQPGLLYVKGG
jgi:cobalt/nickel transport system permease protein